MKTLYRTADRLTPHEVAGVRPLLLVERPEDLRYSGVHEVHVGLDGAVIHRRFTQRWLFDFIETGWAELKHAQFKRKGHDEAVAVITAIAYSGHSHAHALELARAALPTSGDLA